ncbi:mitochondrial ribosome-associated GTPase 1 isoform 5-T6 [Anomaloglossus baeobatrachus]
MRAKLGKVDCIVEVHDARIPLSGRNPLFKEYLGIKPHLLILNKMDLADLSHQKRVITHLEKHEDGKVIYTDCIRDENIKQIVPAITEEIESNPRFNRAEVSENPLIYLLDTPGVLSPRIESLETGMKLALCGTILDHLVGEDIMADYLLYTLNEHTQHRYVEQYELDEPCSNIATLLKKIALQLGKTQRVKAITGIDPKSVSGARGLQPGGWVILKRQVRMIPESESGGPIQLIPTTATSMKLEGKPIWRQQPL